jgi:hypothetical protein
MNQQLAEHAVVAHELVPLADCEIIQFMDPEIGGLSLSERRKWVDGHSLACSMIAQTKISRGIAGAISLLANEFWLEGLLSESSAFQIASTPELISSLSERISKLKRQISSQPFQILAELKESIANHARQLESLDCRISVLGPNLTTGHTEPKRVSLAPVPPVSPSKPLTEVKFPLKKAKSLDGVVSYLSRKHAGNVHDKGIITIKLYFEVCSE